MDITSHNFKEHLEAIEKAINGASFLTIDAEFTGLNASKNLHSFDTPEGRYAKLRSGSLDFLLIQFGLCAFNCKEDQNRYDYKAFNFFVFPKPCSRGGPDIRFMCQSSSMDFLLSQGFDFNKLFNDGISYLSPTEEAKLREQMEQKHYQLDRTPSRNQDNSHSDDSPLRSPIPIPEQHKTFIEDVCKKIDLFLSDDAQVLELEPCNSFLRKLIFQTAKQWHPTGLYLESKATPKKEIYISVTKVSPEKLQEMEQAKKKSEEEELDDNIGFSKIIRLITRSGKLVVGHNMLLDVLHIVHKFSCPLPADYEDFKAITKCVLPRLIDTKLMASTFPFKEKINRTMLSDLLKILEENPFGLPEVVVSDGYKAYDTEKNKLHEAGYDAFITGLCFISMTKYLAKLNNSKETSLKINWNLLEPFTNKLYLMMVHDIPYMNLAGEDLKPNRDHVFYVKFPKEWKTSDLMQLFAPFGRVFVGWIDDSSAFVELSRKDQAELVLRTLTQSDIYHVITYSEYSLRQKKPNPYAQLMQSSVGAARKRSCRTSNVKSKRPKRGSSCRNNHKSSDVTFEAISEEREPDGEDADDADDSYDSSSSSTKDSGSSNSTAGDNSTGDNSTGDSDDTSPSAPAKPLATSKDTSAERGKVVTDVVKKNKKVVSTSPTTNNDKTFDEPDMWLEY